MILRNLCILLAALPVLGVQAQTVQKNVLLEDFSNEECHPCHDMSIVLHPALVSLQANDSASHLNVIAYQLDFPGYDPSYNLHGQQRADFYSIFSLPAARLNGNKGVNPMFDQQQYYTLLDTSRHGMSPFKLSGSYTINTATKQLAVTVSAVALSALQGPYKVYMAVAERYYKSVSSSIGMYDYYFVMRRMLPDGNGRAETSWAANVPKQWQYSVGYQVVNPPAPGSFDFWGNPVLSDVVVFVQDTITREVLQSQVLPASFPTGVAAAGGSLKGLLVYPNPAREVVSVAFELAAPGDVSVLVRDLTGRVVLVQKFPALPAGRTGVAFSTSRLPDGGYRVEMRAGQKAVSRPLVVTHGD